MNSNTNRPLSPHLQIYGWQISMLTSTLHRLSGIGLAMGSVLLAVWLCAAASGPEAFATANGIASAWYGQILMFCWSLTLFYHLCNGVRHLAWDFVVGLELETAKITGYLVIGISIALTVIVWICALAT